MKKQYVAWLKAENLRPVNLSETLIKMLLKQLLPSPTIIKDSVTLKSDLLSEVEVVMDFIKKHINKSYIITGNIQREERWDYPLDAVREIVVNAIVHRDYRDSSDSVIKIFDDRIEFYNPGKLPEDLSIERLLSGEYISTIRNKKIAEIFKEANLIEKYGSGIRRILDGFEKNGLPAPKFEEISNGFRVTAFKSTPQKIPPKKIKDTPQKISLSRRILNVLKENSSMSQREVAEKLGITFDTAKEYFNKLKKEGKLKRLGSRKKGIWQVIEK
jgi:ATP-dependent DNA helicase RecG